MARYGDWIPTSETPLAEGGSAVLWTCFRAGRPDEKALIKVARLDTPSAHDRWAAEHEALSRLHRAGMPVPEPLGAVDIDPLGRPWLPMRIAEGEPLEDWLGGERVALSPEEALRICGIVADVLARAQSLGVQHRDVQPHHILVSWRAEGDTRHPRVTVIDWGHTVGERFVNWTLTDADLDVHPRYAPPEVLAEARVRNEQRWDAYGLSVTLLEAVSGHVLAQAPAEVRKVGRERVRWWLGWKRDHDPLPVPEALQRVPDVLDVVLRATRMVAPSKAPTVADLAWVLKPWVDDPKKRLPAAIPTASVRAARAAPLLPVLFIALLLATLGGAALAWIWSQGGFGTATTTPTEAVPAVTAPAPEPEPVPEPEPEPEPVVEPVPEPTVETDVPDPVEDEGQDEIVDEGPAEPPPADDGVAVVEQAPPREATPQATTAVTPSETPVRRTVEPAPAPRQAPARAPAQQTTKVVEPTPAPARPRVVEPTPAPKPAPTVTRVVEPTAPAEPVDPVVAAVSLDRARLAERVGGEPEWLADAIGTLDARGPRPQASEAWSRILDAMQDLDQPGQVEKVAEALETDGTLDAFVRLPAVQGDGGALDPILRDRLTGRAVAYLEGAIADPSPRTCVQAAHYYTAFVNEPAVTALWPSVDAACAEVMSP